MKPTLAIFLLASALFAGSHTQVVQPGCPASIRNTPNALHEPITIYEGVIVKNVSDKKIVALEMDGRYTNAFGDDKPFRLKSMLDRPIKPHKQDIGSYNTGIIVGEGGKIATFWLTRVKFEDGSTWEDDGSHHCSFSYDWAHR
jgi:hypothetical protein